jgi:L-seryl-tRNA(Ser) seleniumtransferase
METEVVAGTSRVGGGAAPEVDLAGHLVAVRRPGRSAAWLERSLRLNAPPIIARVAGDRLLLDPRTLLEGDEEVLAHALARLCREDGGTDGAPDP